MILRPALLEHLAPIIVALPKKTPPPLSLPVDLLLPTMWPVWFTECLTFFRLLITIDSSNLTRVRGKSFLNKLSQEWLVPQSEQLGRLWSEAREKAVEFEAGFVLERWEDALGRAEEAAIPYR